MSKRELKIYLKSLKKTQLEEQVLDLYARFKPVKTYYNFVFNPKEEKLLEDAKFKIAKEYFPTNTRKPKARRSVAQKIIKHYIQLGVDACVVADVMLFNIEITQKYTKEKLVKQPSFYNSMLKSFTEVVRFIDENGVRSDFEVRINKVSIESKIQNWPNSNEFEILVV